MNKRDELHKEKNAKKAQEVKEVQQTPEFSAQEESYKSKFLRSQADFQNYKRRVDKEREQWMRMAQVSVIEQFLPIVDDFFRALSIAQSETENEDTESHVKGLELIAKNLQKTLTDLGVEEISCVASFDPEYHEALMQVESADHQSGQIIDVLSRGYTYRGSVIRHAKVSVAK